MSSSNNINESSNPSPTGPKGTPAAPSFNPVIKDPLGDDDVQSDIPIVNQPLVDADSTAGSAAESNDV